MIKVTNLVKEFSIDNQSFRALDDVSFEVMQGEIFGVIGLSGAGKSTLVRCINRLEEPSSGNIFIEEQSIVDLSKEELRQERKDIGMIFQSFNLFMQKTVYDNISYPLEIIHMDKDKAKERVEELLQLIDLEHKRNAYPSELSGGQKQRVAIARAIATNPRILLSDEGTSALDPSNTQSVLELIRKIVKEFNMTVIMITHQMEVAKDICDRIAVMDRGRIVEINDTRELFRNPKHKVTKSFIKNLQDNTEEEVISLKDVKGAALRLSYAEGNYDEPILSQCIKKFDVDVNILSGNINKLNVASVGYLTVELLGSPEERARAIEYLKENNVNVEVLS
ncbi:MAG: methionine ABC transporter ATP-binding protein [Tissierellia bacterium]|nr:methionine ABC transporter ATP-binding protein [Tissierellia bacterium]